MQRLPKMVVDLHVHLFNARGLPLAGIIAHAMGKEAGESPFARALAGWLNRITESPLLSKSGRGGSMAIAKWSRTSTTLPS